MEEKKTKGFNTNSDVYTVVYSCIIVIIVAFLLAFVFKGLKPLQEANESLDKKKQILAALNIRDIKDADVVAKYKEVILADEIIDPSGAVIEAGTPGGEKAAFKLNGGDYKKDKLALYICKVEGETKYIIPVYGMGLWGPISGYVAINSDKNTVYGAYFTHESETAGLGAEIKDDVSWQQKFQGKKLFAENGEKIALSVVKKVENPVNQVDGITGATLTCIGVTDMFSECFAKYHKFLTDK